MKSIIITPLYFIDNKLMSIIKDKAGQGPVHFIITDDVSPIFPIEARIEWLMKTLIGVDFPIEFEIESMVQNDENEEFYESLIKRLDAIREVDVDVDITLLHTSECDVEKFEHIGDVVEIKSPLDVRKKHLNPLFATRFWHQFEKFTQPKVKELPSTETYKLVPYYLEDGKPHFGFGYMYTTEELIALWCETSYKPPVAELNAAIQVYTKNFTRKQALSHRILGSASNDTVIAVEIEKPNDFFNNGNTIYIMPEFDVVFLDENAMKLSSDPLHCWVLEKFNEAEEELVEGEA